MDKWYAVTCFLCCSFPVFGEGSFVTAGVNMVNVSYAESASSIEPNATTGVKPEAEAGSLSVMSLTVNFEKSATVNRTYFARASVPLIGSGDSSFLSINCGVNYFFSSMATDQASVDEGTRIEFRPKVRYYVGGQLGGAYLVYTTTTKKRSDILFELGGQGGMLYSFGKNYGLNVEGFFGRGTGVNTTTTNMKLLAAMIYNL